MPISVSPDWTLCCTKAMGCWSRAACWYLMGDVESLILLLLVVLLLVVPYFLWALADRMKLVRSSLASSLLPPSCDWLVPGDKDVILNKGSMCLTTPHLLSCDPRFLFLFVCHKLEQQHSERMKTFNNVFRSPVNVDCQSVASVCFSSYERQRCHLFAGTPILYWCRSAEQYLKSWNPKYCW